MKKARLKPALWLAGWALLVSLAVYCQIENLMQTVKIRFAADQTEIFEQMREKAKSAKADEAAGALSYVLFYYPSGTKQPAGSLLDVVVERARRSAVREIISLLRTKTGRDFGDEPLNWIEGLKAVQVH
jgi:hypothetical protein